MKNVYFMIIMLMIAVLFAGCSNDEAGANKSNEQGEKTPLTISAAISLSDALDEIKANYEKDHPVELTFNLGSSGKLAQQIQQGAPVDAFISANWDWMDVLESKDLVIAETRKDVVGNNIVLIAGKNSNIDYDSIEDINPAEVGQIAIGNPKSVPAGKYAEQTLRYLGKWEALKDNLILAKDVRQVLTYVETGNVDIGLVYQSDVRISDNINVLAVAGDKAHDPIVYPAAVTVDSEHQKAATEFVEYLESEKAQHILGKYGFKK